MQALDIADLEIERRLDAFALARLSPDSQAVARARARVMREARLQFEAARIAAHVVPAMTLASRRSMARRLAMPLVAASVWVGIAVGSVAAAQAGGPLYPARIWIEAATLPASPADRADAEIARLDARLADAMTAAAHGDPGAVAAALDAYRQIADEAVASFTGTESLEDLVGAALDRHRAVLTAVADSLAAKGSTTIAAVVEIAIERAIEHNTAVVASFATNGGGRPTSGADTGGGSGAAGTGASSDGAANTGTGGSQDGQGAAGGGSNGGNGAGGDDGATGQDGGNKPTKEPKPTPDHRTHAGHGPDE